MHPVWYMLFILQLSSKLSSDAHARKLLQIAANCINNAGHYKRIGILASLPRLAQIFCHLQYRKVGEGLGNF